jgi:hypothetical protein|tara:strand:- start:632 stop:877 length:246 start_codon:yes stop_codon:yes gene_type:complete
MIVQALKDIYDSNEKISFEAANYFVSNDHDIVCDNVGLNSTEIRDDVIEALRVGGVKKQRMINDIVEILTEGFKEQDDIKG